VALISEQRPALRRDAERNRQLLLAVAHEVFSEQGLEASLEEIARRAEVGIGTLYRRFPTRTALIEALFEVKARAYAEASGAALREADAWAGLSGLIAHACELQAEDRGFSDVLTASFPAARELHGHMLSARRNIEKLVARARREGAVRQEIVAADLFWILTANAAYLRVMSEVAPNAWRRYLALSLDAIRVPGTGKLPAAPTSKQVVQATEELGRRAS
jgi:AcrR family transcriptional regulator